MAKNEKLNMSDKIFSFILLCLLFVGAITISVSFLVFIANGGYCR